MARVERKSKRLSRRTDAGRTQRVPRLGLSLILLGCFLALYLVGLPLIAIGLRLWARHESPRVRVSLARG